MSKYTTEIRFICENASGYGESKSYKDIDEILTKASPKVFDFAFPIFDENYRLPLEKKILRHFYTREICEETVGLWKLRLCNRLNEIMPYYNKMYESELLEFNPFYDVNYTRSGERKNDEQGAENRTEDTQGNRSNNSTRAGTSETDSTVSSASNSTASSVNRDLYSDTPQGGLQNVENETYLTNARKVLDSSNSQNNSADASKTNASDNVTVNGSETDGRNTTASSNRMANSLEDYSEQVVGKMGTVSYSKLLKEFRETFLNIDMLIINDLGDLFINLW